MNNILTRLNYYKEEPLLLLQIFDSLDFSNEDDFTALCDFLEQEKKTISKFGLKASLCAAMYNN